MGTWEPGVPYTDPTPDQITAEVSTDRTTEDAPLTLSELADLPAGTSPTPTGAVLLGLEDDVPVYFPRSDVVDGTVFDTNVRANRIDQMTAPTATLTWTGAALTAQSVNAGTGTAADGGVTAAASSAFFGGGIIIVKRDSGDVQASAALNITGWVVGAGGSSAPDITFARTGANAATLTCTTLTLAGSLALGANRNISTDTTTGTKIGTATSQKFAFWNKTPIVQPTSGITGATFVANSGTAVNDASTFGGYTVGKAIAALINMGILA